MGGRPRSAVAMEPPTLHNTPSAPIGDTVVHLADWLSCALLGGFLRRFQTGPARAEAARCACLVGVVCLERWSADGEASGLQWALEDLLELAAGLVSGVDLSSFSLGGKSALSNSCAAQARQALEVASLSNPNVGQQECAWNEDVPVYVPESPSQERIYTSHNMVTREHPWPNVRLHSPAQRSRDPGYAEGRSSSVGSQSEDDLSRSRGNTPQKKACSLDTPIKPAGKVVRPAPATSKFGSARRLDSPKVPVMEATQMIQRTPAAASSGRSLLGQQGHVHTGGLAAAQAGSTPGVVVRGRAAEPRSGSTDALRGRRPRSPGGTTMREAPNPSAGKLPSDGRNSSGLSKTTPRITVEAGGAAAAAVDSASPSSGRRAVSGGAPPPRVVGVISPAPGRRAVLRR